MKNRARIIGTIMLAFIVTSEVQAQVSRRGAWARAPGRSTTWAGRIGSTCSTRRSFEDGRGQSEADGADESGRGGDGSVRDGRGEQGGRGGRGGRSKAVSGAVEVRGTGRVEG